jgi:hypothetical protein
VINAIHKIKEVQDLQAKVLTAAADEGKRLIYFAK